MMTPEVEVIKRDVQLIAGNKYAEAFSTELFVKKGLRNLKNNVTVVEEIDIKDLTTRTRNAVARALVSGFCPTGSGVAFSVTHALANQYEIPMLTMCGGSYVQVHRTSKEFFDAVVALCAVKRGAMSYNSEYRYEGCYISGNPFKRTPTNARGIVRKFVDKYHSDKRDVMEHAASLVEQGAKLRIETRFTV